MRGQWTRVGQKVVDERPVESHKVIDEGSVDLGVSQGGT